MDNKPFLVEKLAELNLSDQVAIEQFYAYGVPRYSPARNGKLNVQHWLELDVVDGLPYTRTSLFETLLKLQEDIRGHLSDLHESRKRFWEELNNPDKDEIQVQWTVSKDLQEKFNLIQFKEQIVGLSESKRIPVKFIIAPSITNFELLLYYDLMQYINTKIFATEICFGCETPFVPTKFLIEFMKKKRRPWCSEECHKKYKNRLNYNRVAKHRRKE